MRWQFTISPADPANLACGGSVRREPADGRAHNNGLRARTAPRCRSCDNLYTSLGPADPRGERTSQRLAFTSCMSCYLAFVARHVCVQNSEIFHSPSTMPQSREFQLSIEVSPSSSCPSAFRARPSGRRIEWERLREKPRNSRRRPKIAGPTSTHSIHCAHVLALCKVRINWYAITLLRNE